jgi:hypothetical protein
VKIMDAFRFLKRAYCMDSLAELMNTGEEVPRTFIHDFLPRLSRWGYPLYIKMPTTTEEIRVLEEPFARMGMDGQFGNTDFTHVPWGRCPASQRVAYTGKEGFPTLSFSIICSHAGLILSVSAGFKGAENDKILQRFVCDIDKVRLDDVFTTYPFTLRTAEGHHKAKFGAYLGCDGGYLKIRCLQSTCDQSESREDYLVWSGRMESVRKDIECVNGTFLVQ